MRETYEGRVSSHRLKAEKIQNNEETEPVLSKKRLTYRSWKEPEEQSSAKTRKKDTWRLQKENLYHNEWEKGWGRRRRTKREEDATFSQDFLSSIRDHLQKSHSSMTFLSLSLHYSLSATWFSLESLSETGSRRLSSKMEILCQMYHLNQTWESWKMCPAFETFLQRRILQLYSSWGDDGCFFSWILLDVHPPLSLSSEREKDWFSVRSPQSLSDSTCPEV